MDGTISGDFVWHTKKRKIEKRPQGKKKRADQQSNAAQEEEDEGASASTGGEEDQNRNKAWTWRSCKCSSKDNIPSHVSSNDVTNDDHSCADAGSSGDLECGTSIRDHNKFSSSDYSSPKARETKSFSTTIRLRLR